MSDKKHWITKLVPALAFAAGIIIASVGGIMTTSSSLKLALFDSGAYSYINEEQCHYDSSFNPQMKTLSGEAFDLNIDDAASRQNEKQSPEEIKACILDLEQKELIRFQKNQKENIVDGVSTLIVGGILLLAFRKRD